MVGRLVSETRGNAPPHRLECVPCLGLIFRQTLREPEQVPGSGYGDRESTQAFDLPAIPIGPAETRIRLWRVTNFECHWIPIELHAR